MGWHLLHCLDFICGDPEWPSGGGSISGWLPFLDSGIDIPAAASVDPMFHKFEPLQTKDPALTAEMEKMVKHAGQDIPPEADVLDGSGEKTTTLNAYVTGFGASKRIVVWDTTIAKMTSQQIVYVAGHEMGHYVLNHIPKGFCICGGAIAGCFLYWLPDNRLVIDTVGSLDGEFEG